MVSIVPKKQISLDAVRCREGGGFRGDSTRIGKITRFYGSTKASQGAPPTPQERLSFYLYIVLTVFAHQTPMSRCIFKTFRTVRSRIGSTLYTALFRIGESESESESV